MSENKALCSAYEVDGYPTLLFFKDKHYYQYRGERSLEGLENFAINGGYEHASSYDEIPKKLEGCEYYMKQFNKFLSELIFAIEVLFSKIGL